MKTLLPLSLFFWLTATTSQAQDTTLVLNTSMFSAEQQINLATATGWVYHAGHNPVWASPNMNTTGWVKRNPGTLSLKDADKTGRVEGWFRLRIRLDSSFKGMPLWLRKSNWSAADLYVNGKRLASYGSTGAMGEPYRAYHYFNRWPTPIRLRPGREHLIAFHVVDYKVSFSLTSIKSAFDLPTTQGLRLTGPRYYAVNANALSLVAFFTTVHFISALLIALLLWLLVWKKVGDFSMIRLLAVQTSLTVFYFSTNVISFIEPSLIAFEETYLAKLLVFLSVALLPVILLRMGSHPYARQFTAPLLLIPILAYGIHIVVGTSYVIEIVILILLLILLYILISSWSKLGGASRPIVWGTLVALVFALFFALTTVVIPPGFLQHTFTVINSTVYSLAIPVSFLVYVALRFKEILAEVRDKATALVAVTEEKQQLLAIQNELLEQQVEARTAELNQSLQTLKATQAQLIQKEKLASLGELTAGIAHEIQNPLNFVNNFSELSVDLLDELKTGPLEKLPDSEKDYADEILGDLTGNLQKIHHHGGRAAAIVRGMLEHSRTETGERRPTDLNALAGEYLKIAYQGLRAKDKSFNCEMVTDFAADLGLVEVVPQEIGRVLLNLYNNAFYAVRERQKGETEDYQPTVSVSTKRIPGGIAIWVRDNGTGIPDAVKSKIFQPFFTTKPTGEGTGLGLSLSYDIVTKGHGGTLTVESVEGEGTTFVVGLPIS